MSEITFALLQFDFLSDQRNIAVITAAIIGFIGGIFSTFGIYIIRKRERKKKLRKALLVEIQIPKETINKAARIDSSNIADIEKPAHTGLPTSVHDSHIDDLGLLSSYELEPVITYYSGADVASEQLENFDKEVAKESFVDETAPNLKDARDDAEERIKVSLRWFGWLRRIWHKRKNDD